MINKILPVIALMILVSCNENNSDSNHSDMKYGAPEARVSQQSNTAGQTGPLAYAPNVPKLAEGDTVVVKFDVQHKLFTVKNGVQLAAWVFGDSIPGPVLRVRVGQTVKFSMTDRSDDTTMKHLTVGNQILIPMPHSMDFHAAMVSPEDKFRSISPGETIEFSWTANYPGVFMYHCGTPMVLMHMIAGMVGMVIVEPADGYPDKVDREFAIIQNEYYLKQQGNIFIPDTALALKREPSYVAFNGKVGQYVIRPLKAKAGERIKIYFLNVGANNISSFHVIGTIMDKVYIEGNPANKMVGMQAALVGPAQGAICEFVLPEKGRYPFVDHSFANAELGAAGTILAE